MMTRKQMEEVLGRNESVIYRGRSITDVKDLPTEEELAAGDAEATAKVADSIEEQIRRLEARRDRLVAPKVATSVVPRIAAAADVKPAEAPESIRPSPAAKAK